MNTKLCASKCSALNECGSAGGATLLEPLNLQERLGTIFSHASQSLQRCDADQTLTTGRDALCRRAVQHYKPITSLALKYEFCLCWK